MAVKDVVVVVVYSFHTAQLVWYIALTFRIMLELYHKLSALPISNQHILLPLKFGVQDRSTVD